MSDLPPAPDTPRRSRERRRRSTTDPGAIAERLAAIRGRHAGSDAERRAALLLADELRRAGREARVDTFWVRAEWSVALAIACAVAVFASVLAVNEPEIAFVVLGLALAGAIVDLGGRWIAFRALTPARATQNVISRPAREGRIRLLVTAATDVPRPGGYRRVDGWLGGRAAWLIFASMAGIAVICILRQRDVDERWVGYVQLVPTFLLIGLLTGLLENRRAKPMTGANAGSGAAAAIALAARLDARPPRNLGVEVVLAGAGDSGGAQGLAHRLQQLRDEPEVAVLHIEPCGKGILCWWRSDGLLTTLPFHPSFLRSAEQVADTETRFGADEYRGRGATGALAARRRRRPALSIGAWTPAEPCTQDVEADVLRSTVGFAHALLVRLDRTLDEPQA